MAIVLDANLLIVLVSGDSRREPVLSQMTQWLQLSKHTALCGETPPGQLPVDLEC